MSVIHAEVPDKLFQQVTELARRENMPVERLVSLALAQALGAWQTQSVIAERARNASREDFLRFMDQVPAHEPVEGDKVTLTLDGEQIGVQRDATSRATWVEENGRKVLVAPPDDPPMTAEAVKAALSDFP